MRHRKGGGIVSQIERCHRFLEDNPPNPSVLNTLGSLLLGWGKPEPAAHSFHAALTLAPHNPAIYSNLLHALLECPSVSPRELADAHLSFGARFDSPAPPFTNSRSLRRPLRIGYLSDGFRSHAIPIFFEPLLRAHDPARFIVHCYSNARASDAVTSRLKRRSHRWFDIAHLTDDDAGALIRGHQLDILVELGGHIGNNRLGLLSRRLAPIQMSTSDYPCTAGSRAIDYHLTDRTMCPAGSDAFYAERIVRLPHVAMCFERPRPSPPVAPLPAQRNGYITFAAFHRPSKLTPATLDAWAQTMRALPGSRIVIHHLFEGRQTVSKDFRAGIESALNARGIVSRRLRFVGACSRFETLRMYHQADLTLDTFPYSGCTTSAESLWMGVLPIGWRDRRESSRHTATMLRQLGLDRFAAASPEEAVRTAVDLASDLPALAALRRALRPAMLSSPLMDAALYAKSVEAVYRRVWTRWVREHPRTT